MQISPEQGAFMGWLVGALGVKRVLEVGVFTGYSSIAMALALPPGGCLVACDRDPKAMAMARDYWQRAGVADKASLGQPACLPALPCPAQILLPAPAISRVLCGLQIDERLGPAADTLDGLLADPAQHGSYDFAFIDADKKASAGGMRQDGGWVSRGMLAHCVWWKGMRHVPD